MAVKYSKQRDFGAKGRKTRKMGKKIWTIRRTYKLKSQAQKFAKSLRSARVSGRSYMARVVKITRGGKVRYGVYTHTK
tara:strand:+ start:539 stop:772 length:234 start_codon:yes stop_codon:yes gene_type:complete